MKECSVTVHDRDGDIVLTREDLLKYASKENVIASALMIRLCRFAFEKLSPNASVHRRELYWQVGFPGPGILDCVEMISHAVRDGRCLQNPTLSHPQANAPASLVGSFLFEIRYRSQTLTVWPDASVLDDEFRQQVSTWQAVDESTEGYGDYLRYKAEKVQQIMTLPDSALFHYA